MASPIQYHNIQYSDNDDRADTNHTIKQPASSEHSVPEDGSLLAKIKLYNTLFDSNVSELQALIGKLKGITDDLETTHRNTTIGRLSGGVIGAAGGITSIVGLALVPFTLSTSLIVTGVGAGVAVAGGVTGAVSNITDKVKQKNSRQEIEEILNTFQNKTSPILECLKDIEVLIDEIQKTELNESSTQRIQAIFGITRVAGHAAELLRLVNFAEIGAVAAQVSRTMRAAAAMIGVVSGLFLLFDIFGSEKSNVVKFIQQMRKTHDHLQDTLNKLQEVKEKIKAEFTDKLKDYCTE